jgi:hypothetical protein
MANQTIKYLEDEMIPSLMPTFQTHQFCLKQNHSQPHPPVYPNRSLNFLVS